MAGLKPANMSLALWVFVAFASLASGARPRWSQGRSDSLNDRFVCVENKCIQASLSPDRKVRYDSIELCRMMCSPTGSLWPLPTISIVLGHMAMEIDPNNIKIIVDSAPSETRKYIQKIGHLFVNHMYSECKNMTARSSTSVNIHMSILSKDLDLNLETDESYKLNVKTTDKSIGVEINATTVYGARHALETLKQLTARRLNNGRCSLLMLTRAEIKDRPIFKHRGILLDTSRTYLPVKDIERTLDAMGSVKLNVLHWHATDSHSFPLAFERFPQSEFAKYGAYSSSEIYTTKDMRHLVQYAKERGVRIMLEIDSPAHAGNGWQFGEETGYGPLVLCTNMQPWRRYCVQPPCGQMNPANPNLYVVLQNLYKEISEIFSQDMFHMGGDEVHLPCWMASDEISRYMDERGWPKTEENYMRLWSEFHGNILKRWDVAVGHENTKPVLWTSQLTSADMILDRLDPKRYIIESWTDTIDPLPEQLVEKGFSVIYATRDVWYLDHGFWGSTTYHNWMKIYEYKIPEHEKVLGGEVAMWGELASPANLDFKIWPRAAALAEQLWSSPINSAQSATYRLLSHSQRLLRMGIGVDQIVPEWCYLNEGRCA